MPQVVLGVGSQRHASPLPHEEPPTKGTDRPHYVPVRRLELARIQSASGDQSGAPASFHGPEDVSGSSHHSAATRAQSTALRRPARCRIEHVGPRRRLPSGDHRGANRTNLSRATSRVSRLLSRTLSIRSSCCIPCRRAVNRQLLTVQSRNRAIARLCRFRLLASLLPEPWSPALKGSVHQMRVVLLATVNADSCRRARQPRRVSSPNTSGQSLETRDPAHRSGYHVDLPDVFHPVGNAFEVREHDPRVPRRNLVNSTEACQCVVPPSRREQKRSALRRSEAASTVLLSAPNRRRAAHPDATRLTSPMPFEPGTHGAPSGAVFHRVQPHISWNFN